MPDPWYPIQRSRALGHRGPPNYHPVTVAQATAAVEHLAPGRVYVGVSTGEALNEYASTGLWPEYDERQERMAEAIDLIRALWTGEEVSPQD